MNDSRPTSLEQTPPDNYLDRREISEISYTYRPTPIDVDSQQQRNFLPTSSPSINKSRTSTHQRRRNVVRSFWKVHYEPKSACLCAWSAKYATAVFESCMGPCLIDLIAMKPRNPRDWVFYGAPPPKPGQSDGKKPGSHCPCHCRSWCKTFQGHVAWAFLHCNMPTHQFIIVFYLHMPHLTGFLPIQTPFPTSSNLNQLTKPTNQTPAAETPPTNNTPSTPKVPLFGSAHGMFFDPSTGLFTGDGAPRKSPYRPDGTLPSKPDLESDFLTKQQYPEPAEDQLHIMSKREYTKRMANFGKEGPIQRFSVARPTKLQGNQQGTRVMVGGSAGERSVLGRRVHTAHETEGEGSMLGRRVHTPHEIEGEEGNVPSRRTQFPNEQEGEISMSGHRTQAWEETAAELARMNSTNHVGGAEREGSRG